MPDEVHLVGAVTGALVPLTDPENWETDGTMTPDEAAGIMSAAFEAFVAGDCSGGECPPIELPDGGGRVYRRNPDTDKWEYIDPVTGEWVEPSGDEAVPPIPARTEATDAEKICAAATNAVNVYQQIYDYIYTDWIEEQNNAIVWADASVFIGTTIGAWIYPPIAGLYAFISAAFAVFTLAFEVISPDLWDEWFTREFICILKSNATLNDDDSVTFDYGQVRIDIFETLGKGAYVMLVLQVDFIVATLGSQALNTAGGTDAVEGDCSRCGEWAREFNFALGQNGWTTANGNEGAWNTAGYWQNGSASGNTTLIMQVNPTANTGWQVTRIRYELYLSKTTPFTEAPNSRNYPGSVRYLSSLATGWATYELSGFSDDNVQYIGFRAFCNSVAGAMTARIRRITVWGTGTMPFSDLQGQPYSGV